MRTHFDRALHALGAGCALTLSAGQPVAWSADLDPSGQGGQYQSAVTPTLIKGAGGAFGATTIWAPLILLNDPATMNPRQSLLAGSVAQWVGGGPVGVVCTYQASAANTAADRSIIVLGTSDAASGVGASTNEILREVGARSNAVGSLQTNGTLLIYERLGLGQNNLGLLRDVLGVVPQTVGPGAQAPWKIFGVGSVGIGNASETALVGPTAAVTGRVEMGPPSATVDPAITKPVGDEDLLVAVTTASTASSLGPGQVPACSSGVMVTRGLDNDPQSGGQGEFDGRAWTGTPGPAAVASWWRWSVPMPTNPAGEYPGDARQTQPVIKTVNTPSGARVVYVTHGIGFAGNTPFGGGAARPVLLAVDVLRGGYAAGQAVAEENTIVIEADAAGGVGSAHGAPLASVEPAPVGFADHWNTARHVKFVDVAAADIGGEPLARGMFDMNARGEIAALWVNEAPTPQRFEVRLYRPLWNGGGDRIVGYTLGAVVTRSGDLDVMGNPLYATDLRTTISVSSGVFEEFLIPPFSGVSLDDAGRVAFVGVMEKFEVSGDWDWVMFTPETRYLQNVTTGLFVWEPVTESLHLIVKGGQNGDSLIDAFSASGPASNETLALGVFGFGGGADAFGRGSMSSSGGVIALNFRSCGNQFVAGVNQELERRPDFSTDTFLDRGGVLHAPGALGVDERSARGTLMIALGAFVSQSACCAGNANKVTPGVVNFDDVTSVLANWGASYAPQSGLGDGNCDGTVNFDDLTAALANWSAACP